METQKEFDQVEYLKNQMKYLGFGEGEKLHKDLEKGINSKNQQFEIKTTSDKALPENKVDFTLKFNKTDSGGIFLNSYNAKLTNENSEEVSHNFPVNRENTFTAKEAINLLEGRSVKIEFHNPKSDQQETAFVQFNFDEPKTEKGNWKYKFHQSLTPEVGREHLKKQIIEVTTLMSVSSDKSQFDTLFTSKYKQSSQLKIYFDE